MTKELKITITASGETEQDCDESLREGVGMINGQIKYKVYPMSSAKVGNLDESVEEIHWEYEVKMINQ